MVGTPAYMAPEQISGKPIDGRTDLYSAGLIFHELLSGQRAFTGETIARILHAQMNEPPPPVPLPLPEVLSQTLQKFYEKRPEDRFQDAAEADRALVACEEALRSFSGGVAAPGARQEGVAPAPAVAPEAFSATMMRPEAGAGGPAPTPARPVTDRQLAPAQFASDGRPAPSRPVTDRHPVPAPLVTAPPPAAVVPAAAPAPAPAPAPKRGLAPAQGQRKQSSGMGKGCLIAGLVLGVTGCMGMSALGFLVWLSGQNGAAGGMNHHANSVPSTGQFQREHYPDPGNAPHPPPDEGSLPDDDLLDAEQAQQEAQAALKPACYIRDILLESDQDNGPDAPWEFVGFVSYEPIPCPLERFGKPSARLQALAQQWHLENEEILGVEPVSGPHPVAGEPGLFRKTVRARTKVSESMP